LDTSAPIGISVRVAAPGDAGAVAAIYAPYVQGTAISFEERPPSPAEWAARIDRTLATHPFLVACGGGEVLGYAYAGRHRARHAYRFAADVSVYVAASGHRRGVGRVLYRALLDALRRQGVWRVHAGLTLPNPASVGLHEALGFRPVGVYRSVGYKLGAWRDVGWWAMSLREGEGPPEEPRPFSAIGWSPPAG